MGDHYNELNDAGYSEEDGGGGVGGSSSGDASDDSAMEGEEFMGGYGGVSLEQAYATEEQEQLAIVQQSRDMEDQMRNAAAEEELDRQLLMQMQQEEYKQEAREQEYVDEEFDYSMMDGPMPGGHAHIKQIVATQAPSTTSIPSATSARGHIINNPTISTAAAPSFAAPALVPQFVNPSSESPDASSAASSSLALPIVAPVQRRLSASTHQQQTEAAAAAAVQHNDVPDWHSSSEEEEDEEEEEDDDDETDMNQIPVVVPSVVPAAVVAPPVEWATSSEEEDDDDDIPMVESKSMSIANTSNDVVPVSFSLQLPDIGDTAIIEEDDDGGASGSGSSGAGAGAGGGEKSLVPLREASSSALPRSRRQSLVVSNVKRRKSIQLVQQQQQQVMLHDTVREQQDTTTPDGESSSASPSSSSSSSSSPSSSRDSQQHMAGHVGARHRRTTSGGQGGRGHRGSVLRRYSILQMDRFDYASVARPPRVPDKLFFFCRRAFQKLDKECIGRVVPRRLLLELEASGVHDYTTTHVVQYLENELVAYQKSNVYFFDFIHILNRSVILGHGAAKGDGNGDAGLDEHAKNRGKKRKKKKSQSAGGSSSSSSSSSSTPTVTTTRTTTSTTASAGEYNMMDIVHTPKMDYHKHKKKGTGERRGLRYVWWQLRQFHQSYLFWKQRQRPILWRESFARVESTAGASVASYFHFARSVFKLNLLNAILFMFILIPGLLNYDFDDITGSRATGLLLGDGLERSFLFYSNNYVLHPEILLAEAKAEAAAAGTSTPSSSHTTMIDSIRIENHFDMAAYNMDLAWILVCAASLVVNLYITLSALDSKSASGKNTNRSASPTALASTSSALSQEDEDAEKISFCCLVFGGYDHNVTNPVLINLGQATVVTALSEAFAESVAQDEDISGNGIWDQYEKEIRRVVGGFLTFLVVGIACATISLILVNETAIVGTSTFENNALMRYAKGLLLPVTVASCKFGSIYLLTAIVKYERFETPVLRFRHLFIRLLIVRIAMITVLLFNTLYGSSLQLQLVGAECSNTAVGIVFYKMVVVDAVVEMSVSTFGAWGSMFAKRRLHSLQEYRKRRAGETTDGTDGDDSTSGDDSAGRRRQLREGASAKDVEVYKPKSQYDDEKDAIQGFLFEEDNRFKADFRIEVSLIDLVYRQVLVWCGTPFAPSLPLMATFLGALCIWAKIAQVKYWIRPPVRPMGVDRQNRYLRTVMIFVLSFGIIPFSLFLRRDQSKMTCGPFFRQQPLQVLYHHMNQLPTLFAVAFRYTQNVVVLWLVFILVVVYVLVLRRRIDHTDNEVGTLRNRLRVEVKEKQAMIRDNNIQLDVDHERGRDLFKSWMEDLGSMGEVYGVKFQQTGYDDLFLILKMTDEDLAYVMHEWHAPQTHIDYLKQRVYDKRIEFIH